MSARLRDPRLPTFAFATAVLAAGILIAVLQSSLTTLSDEWYFLLGRRDFDLATFLDPHNEHIAISHIAVYKAVLALFGMESARPFQTAGMLMFLLSVVLVFVFLRRRVGAWPALALSLPLLFFGPATDNLLWPFQLAFSGSMAAGIGALLALDREDRGGDLLGCGLLIAALSFSSAGIPFVVAAAVLVITGPERGRRVWVAALPLGLFALWWLTYGREADAYISFKNIATGPSFAIDGIASSLSSMLGLATPGGESGFTSLEAGRPLLIIAAGFAAWRLHRLGRIPRGVWVALALLVSFWGLTALNANVFRIPVVARYQLLGAVFILILFAELLRGVRFSRPATAAIFAVAALAIASNLESMRQQWRGLEAAAVIERGALSAAEIGREQIDPHYVVRGPAQLDIFGNAGLYLEAVDESGSPSYTPDELAQAPVSARLSADSTFADAYPVRLERLSGELAGSGPAPRAVAGRELAGSAPGCVDLGPDDFGNAVVVLPPGGGTLGASGDSGVHVDGQRYSSDFPLDLGEVKAGGSAVLAIPPDDSAQTWELRLSEFSSATVCGPRPSD